ncbi:MAG TPA: hypothetical protein VGR35_01165 [Tepidisphaeraceae bacterium]|nr:hypothetical protein [Tepidisphaeraceae bacterium]
MCTEAGRSKSGCWVTGFVLFASFVAAPVVHAETWRFKEEFLPHLVKAVPTILSQQDKKTGRFGKGIWIVTDQHAMYPLATAWAMEHPENPHFHSQEVLEAVMAAGDALIEDADAKGQWEFRKKDGSTWGKIWMPWTYSRWVRAYTLIKDAMPNDRRERWEKALTLGYDGIAKHEMKTVHNIPTHHAMGLYIAGKALARTDWCEQASAFMKKAVAQQDPAGFWSENLGPVVQYDFVYVDALGTYYALSGDQTVLPALQKAATFHANFTYPDGSDVETIDERNGYHQRVTMPNVGFTFSPEGRGYIRQQYARRDEKTPLGADLVASYLLYGEEGDAVPAPGSRESHQFVLGNNDAMVRRQGPWFACLSAYTAQVPRSRWIQDRQNFLSLYHDKAGVFLGGGNTKLQPLWSTFTVGDVSLLKHEPGDESPHFVPPKGIVHVPTSATLDPEAASLILDYDGTACAVQVDLSDPTSARITYVLATRQTQPVEAHVTLLPRMNTPWKTESGRSGMLGDEPITLAPGEAGKWIEHHGVRVSLPPQASITWPVLPHNPYRKDGRAGASEGRIVITLPFSPDLLKHELTITVVE